MTEKVYLKEDETCETCVWCKIETLKAANTTSNEVKFLKYIDADGEEIYKKAAAATPSISAVGSATCQFNAPRASGMMGGRQSSFPSVQFTDYCSQYQAVIPLTKTK